MVIMMNLEERAKPLIKPPVETFDNMETFHRKGRLEIERKGSESGEVKLVTYYKKPGDDQTFLTRGWSLWGPWEAPAGAGRGRQIVRKDATGSRLLARILSMAPSITGLFVQIYGPKPGINAP